MEFPYVAIDVETTGLNAQNDEVLEVTAIEFNKSGNLGDKISMLCRPLAGFVPPKITEINNITYDMVKDSPVYLNEIRDKVASFVGTRILVGHNLKKFDIGFLKITPTSMEDTLEICRRRYPGGNNLKTACIRVGIKWDDSQSHRSEYDTIKCIELYCKIKSIEEKESVRKDTPLFDAAQQINKKQATGVVVHKDDITILETQSYSHSRINLYKQCKFKWFMQYVKKMKEPPKDYFLCGNVCHKAAEWTAEWVYREFFANLFIKYCEVKQYIIGEDLKYDIATKFNLEPFNVDYKWFAYYLYRHPTRIKECFNGLDGINELLDSMKLNVDKESYERPSMPDRETFDSIIKKALKHYKCSKPQVIKDVCYIMEKFYSVKDFSILEDEVVLTEQNIALDKDLNVLKDFYSNRAYIRGIVDSLSYCHPFVIITDYKTSRKMMTIDELKKDMQMKMYVMLIYHFLPKNSYEHVIVRIEYIRFGKVIEYQINDVKAVADEAMAFVKESVQDIETEMLKTDGSAFEPTRNEYCHTCYLGEDGICPLVNQQFVGLINDVSSYIITDVDTCVKAWKRIEANKAENSRLLKMCKTFAEGCDSVITIDDKAILDFYTKTERKFDPLQTSIALKGKGLNLNQIIGYFSITDKEFNKICEINKITFNEDELKKISDPKISTKFEAYTKEEIDKKFEEE